MKTRDDPTNDNPIRDWEDVHACDMCGRSGADHKTPTGTWIHKSCGMREWQKLVDRENRRKARKATRRIVDRRSA